MKNVKKYKSSIAIDLKRMRGFRFYMVSGVSFAILKTLRHGQKLPWLLEIR